jgi:hypothetical protein
VGPARKRRMGFSPGGGLLQGEVGAVAGKGGKGAAAA